MITEKTIKKHRYFTTGNGDIWMLESIATVKVAKIQRIDRIGDCREIVLGSPTEFVPVKLPAPDTSGRLTSDEVHETKEPSPGPVNHVEDPPAPEAKPGKNRVKTSNYFGVSASKPTAGGDKRWKAKVWESENKKALTMGTFKSEELAAAAVQQYRGNADEAARLRKLHLDKKSFGTTAAWECNKCGIRHEGQSKPSTCENCRNGSFTRMLPDGRGASDNVRESPDE